MLLCVTANAQYYFGGEQAPGTVRVSFKAQAGGVYAIQVDAAIDSGGPFLIKWKYAAGA